MTTSLRRRVFRRVAWLLAVVFSAGSALHAAFTVAHHRKTSRDMYAIRARVLAGEMERQVLWDDRVSIRRVLDRLLRDDPALAYGFLTIGGAPFESSFSSGIPEGLLGRPEGVESIWTFRDRDGRVHYDVTAPIPQASAALHLGVRRASLDREMVPLVGSVTAVGLALVAVGALLARLVSRRVTREVEALARALKELGEGDRNRLDVQDGGTDVAEVAAVVEAFDRMLAQRLRNEAEQRRLSDIVEATSDIVLLAGTDGTIAYLNRAGRRLLGAGGSGPKPRSLQAVFPPWALAQLLGPAVSEAARAGIWEGESAVLLPGGTELPVSQVVIAHRGGEYFSAVHRDISESKRAEETLRRGRDYLQSVVDGLPEAVMVMAPDRSVRLANRALLELAGKPGEEVAGWSCHRLLYGRSTPCGEDQPCPLDEVLRTGAPARVERLVQGAGGERWQEIAASPTFGDDGRVVEVIESIRDVTERRRHEAEARRLEAELQRTQRIESLAVLAGGVAHDFNNLLMGVLGNVELAAAKIGAGHPARTCLDRAQKAALRAADLAGQMLAYSGRGRVRVGPVDLNRLVAEMGELTEAVVSARATVAYDLAPGLAPVEGDATQLRQVVMNLIANAAEAMAGGGGTIRVSTGTLEGTRATLAGAYPDDNIPDGPYAFVRVADSGSGLAPETIARVFDPFFTTKFTGRGLGLAAALGIVRGHGGAIQVESRLGQGAAFTVLLPPRTPTAAPAKPEALPPPPEVRRWEGAVLLADDEEALRAVGRELLEELGFEVVTAVDGAEALELYRARGGAFALAILDLTMPGLGGVQVCRKIKELEPQAKVLLSSGYDESDAAGFLAEGGAAGFLHKPYRRAALASIVARVLDRPAG